VQIFGTAYEGDALAAPAVPPAAPAATPAAVAAAPGAAAAALTSKEKRQQLKAEKQRQKSVAIENKLKAKAEKQRRKSVAIEDKQKAKDAIMSEKLKPRKPIGGADDGYGESCASKVTARGAKEETSGKRRGSGGNRRVGHKPGQSFDAESVSSSRPIVTTRSHLASGMANVLLDSGGLDELRVQARGVLKQKQEVKKRTLDGLILEEVGMLLDLKDERDATLDEEEDGQMDYHDAYGQVNGEGMSMVTVAFDPGPVGMGFAKNHSGYFVVQVHHTLYSYTIHYTHTPYTILCGTGRFGAGEGEERQGGGCNSGHQRRDGGAYMDETRSGRHD
jgi:hypothetical protein